jgi:hypothetical protein
MVLMTDDITMQAVRKARGYALYIEDAADFVGANDPALANHLYAGAGALKLYAKKLEER